MTNRGGDEPVLLLDEALDELDEERRSLLLQLMDTHPQVLLTTSTEAVLPTEFRERSSLLAVSPGEIRTQPPARARAS